MEDIITILSMKDIDEHFKAIRGYITGLQSSNNRLRETLDKYNMAHEIQEKDAEIDRIRRNSLVVMTDLEREKQQEFMRHHYKKCKNAGRYLYELCGTGIGTAIKIKCPVCGTEEDITDYGTW